MTNDELLKAFEPAISNGKISGRWRLKFAKEGQAILNAVPDAESISEALFRIKNGIERPKCATCGGQIKFSHKHHEYSRFCSPRCGQMNAEVRSKLKETNLEKYGVENPGAFGSDKFKEAMQEKYGTDTPMRSEVLKDKVKATNLEKYGAENVFASDHGKKKIVETMMKTYGVSCSMKDPGVKQKFRLPDGSWKPAVTNVEMRIKNKLISDTNRIKAKLKEFGFELLSENITGFGNKTLHTIRHSECGHEFEQSLFYGRIPRCWKCDPKRVGTSKLQERLEEAISQHVSIEVGRRLLDRQEIDIFIPSHNIGIEVNGLFWHSELAGKDKWYHQKKTDLALSKGIQLFQIFEDTLNERFDIVVAYLLAELGFAKTILADECDIMEVTSNEASDFFDKNHLQGSSKSDVSIGLYFHGSIMALASFSKTRYNKKQDWELVSFCNLNNYVVSNGISKIIRFFCESYKPKSIVTYVDRTFCDGKIFTKSGFTKIKVQDPEFQYLQANDLTRYPQYLFKMNILKNNLKKFDPSLSILKNMKDNGWNRVWDCGQLVFELNLEKSNKNRQQSPKKTYN